ncbi:O-methyltransferase [Myxococcota bacterium]|nr:O-methyltransferase [Myxococcota bacterium]
MVRVPMEMTPERWSYTRQYLKHVFGAEDDVLAALAAEAKAEGLPDIAVSADVGRLLAITAALAVKGSDAPRAIEVGTLGGYSAIWIARAIGARGKLYTIEYDDRHARFAERWLERAGLKERVELRRGKALDELERLSQELGPRSVDYVFLDADKLEYPEYFRRVRPLIRPGGVLVADNVLGSSSWWIDQEGRPHREAAHALNTALATDEDFVATAVPLREGLLVAHRVR